MKITKYSSLILILAVILAGCTTQLNGAIPAEQSIGDPSLPPVHTPIVSTPEEGASFETQIDQQGAISVEVTPLNLTDTTKPIQFEVSLDTHSVDLSMDLATLATISINGGTAIPALKWDAPRGGHHIEGTLSFPVEANGVNLLNGATEVILVIRNLDASERDFAWSTGTQTFLSSPVSLLQGGPKCTENICSL